MAETQSAIAALKTIVAQMATVGQRDAARKEIAARMLVDLKMIFAIRPARNGLVARVMSVVLSGIVKNHATAPSHLAIDACSSSMALCQ